jgi:hypothetical protein
VESLFTTSLNRHRASAALLCDGRGYLPCQPVTKGRAMRASRSILDGRWWRSWQAPGLEQTPDMEQAPGLADFSMRVLSQAGQRLWHRPASLLRQLRTGLLGHSLQLPLHLVFPRWLLLPSPEGRTQDRRHLRCSLDVRFRVFCWCINRWPCRVLHCHGEEAEEL